MTVEKLQEANELLARINKTKEIKAILELDNIRIVSPVSTGVAIEGDDELRKKLIEAVEERIESLEYDFKWFEIHHND